MLLIGVAGLLICIVGAFIDPSIALAAWLTTALAVVGLPLGAMTILMIHGLTGGRWGEAMRPPLRAAVATLPLALLFLLPVLLRLDLVFPWAASDTVTLPEVVRAKLAYLNVPFFIARFAGCAILWLVLGYLVLQWTAPSVRRTRARGFAVGLILQAALVTVFSTDWMLSLDPEFSSTIYAMLEASAEVVGAAALALLVLATTRAIEAVAGGDENAVLGEDVANMLFGFMLTWAYLAFMQWIVVWAGDLPNDIGWYLRRASGGWSILLWLVVLLQFVLPFAACLARDVKRSRRGLVWLAIVLLAGHVLETAWRIRPALGEPRLSLVWLELAAPVAGGCLWAVMYVALLNEPQRILFWRENKVHG